MSVPRLLLLASLSGALFGGADLLPGQAPVKTVPGETRKRELFQLPNDELLQQARSLLRKNDDAFLADLRGLATVEALLEKARARTAKVEIPEKLPPAPVHGKDPKAEVPKTEVPRTAVAFAQTRLDATRRRQQLLENEKSLLEYLAARIEAADSSALALSGALDELGGYVLELSLRRQDGTLEVVPAEFTSPHLHKRKDALHATQQHLKQRAQTARKELENLGRVLDESRKELDRVEAEHALAARKFARETRRQEAERQFADQDFDFLLDRFRALREEEVGLRGTFNLALRRFRIRSGEVDSLRKDLDGLKQPTAKVPALVRAEDVDQAVRATQAMLDHAGKRIDAMTRIGSALEELIGLGSACEADAAVLEEHLFKMQVLVGVLRQRADKGPASPKGKEAKKPSLPPDLAAFDPAQAVLALNETVSEVVGTTRNVRKELQELQTRIDRTRTAVREDRTRLTALKQSLEATRQVLLWEDKLRAFTTEQALASFQTTDKELRGLLKRLPGERAAYEKSRAFLDKARARLDSLKDPLHRQAEKEMLSQRTGILNELRKYAGLEREAKAERPPGEIPPSKALAPEPAKAKSESDQSREKEDRADLGRFQQLLSTWARIVDEQAEKKTEVLRAHAALDKTLETYANTLAECRRLALQQHATAIDLKKRLGRGELKPELIPDGVTEALKREASTRLDADATALVNAREPLQEERERLARPEKELQEVRTLARDILGHIGRRLDLTDELARLEEESRKELDQRSESETKRIEQAAAQRQADDDNPLDFLLGIDNSPAAQRLTELLQSYYRELVDLEERRDSLETQRSKIEKLLETAQKEQGLTTRIRPLLREVQDGLARSREEEYLLIRMRLRPEEADELLKGHQARTGRILNKPPPLPEKDRAAAAAEAAQDLFETDLRLEALRRWSLLFTDRLSPSGIDAEMGRYQERLGALNAQRAALQRRVVFLAGKSAAKEVPPEAGRTVPAEEEAGTVPEIDRVRKERFRVRRAGVLRILGKIGAVLFLAFLLPRLAGLLLGRFGRREGVTTHGQLVLSFLRAFIKLVVWIAALVVILSTLGFDITAILAALGIGGLAIGLAAQETISDIIGGILIFVERPFSIGDTIVIGEAEPARVVGLSWRATRMRAPSGNDLTVPNREVMKSNIRNLTKNGLTFDSLVLPLPVNLPVERVLAVLGEALNDSPSLAPEGERGVAAPDLELAEAEAFVRYTPWWHVQDYDGRNAVRAEVLGNIWKRLRQADLLTANENA